MKWLLVLLVANPIFALAVKTPAQPASQPPDQICQDGMEPPRVRAFMSLIRKALADGVIASPGRQTPLTLERLESPLRVTDDNPLNTSLKTVLSAARTQPDRGPESQAIHAELATLETELYKRIDSTTAGAQQATAGTVAPKLIFKTAWQGDYKVSYPIFFSARFGGPRSLDRNQSQNHGTEGLRTRQGRGPDLVDDPKLSQGEWGSWFHLLDSHNSANGHFYLTYPPMNEKKLCLYDLDGPAPG